MSNHAVGCAWPPATQQDVLQPTNDRTGSYFRADCSYSTNLMLTRGSVRSNASSPEASLDFLFSEPPGIKRMGATCYYYYFLTTGRPMFSCVQSALHVYSHRVDLIATQYEQ